MKNKNSKPKSVLDEFKTFILRGSVIDLSVGIIIGAAFNKIVNSLVSDIIMPPVGLVLGRADFSDFYINLGSDRYESLAAAQAAGAPTINYGLFVNSLVGFLITAVAIFFLIKLINRLRVQEEKKPPSDTDNVQKCPFCLSQIPKKAVKCLYCTSSLTEKEV